MTAVRRVKCGFGRWKRTKLVNRSLEVVEQDLLWFGFANYALHD